MAGKKKGKKIKKKSTQKSSDQVEPGLTGTEENAPTPTDKKKSGKKKKGSKKSKLSLAEKLLVKLEKGVELLKANKLNYEHFVQTADAWMLKHGHHLKALFMSMDEESDGVVNYDDMKSALYDMDCPMSMLEKHLLCKLLDSDNSGDIEYMEFGEGLRHYMRISVTNEQSGEYSDESEEGEDEEEEVYTLHRGQSAKDIKHCPCCKVGLWKPQEVNIRYAEVSMMLITFADTLKKHPCHFTRTIHTHLTVYGLIQLIKSEVGIQSTTICIFRNKSRSEESKLQPDMTLEQCGYDGRDWHNPMEHVLYYDYTSEFNKCPILLCDHYFTNRSKVS